MPPSQFPFPELEAPRTAPGRRAAWWSTAHRLVDAALAFQTPDGSGIDPGGRASSHGRDADLLEGFARLFLIHSFASGSSMPTSADTAALQRHRERFASGLESGARRWPRPAATPQTAVEAASLALGMWLDPVHGWDTLDEGTRDRLADWLADAALVAHGAENNWRLFGAVVAGFLQAQERSTPRLEAVFRLALDAVEGMYAGQGWYSDGGRRTFDYYNSYAFHFYPALLARLSGDETLRAGLAERASAYCRDLLTLMARDGGHVYFGRSLVYRFGVSAALSAAGLLGADLDAASLRVASARNVEHFLRGGAVDDRGILRLGWFGADDAVLQAYSGPMSAYWAGKVFANLLLPPSHPYWGTAHPTMPPAAQRVAPAGLLVHRPGPDLAVLVNHGSHNRFHTDVAGLADDRFYSHLAYSSATGPATAGPARSAGIALRRGDTWWGRSAVVATDGGERWASSAWRLQPLAGGAPAGTLRVLTVLIDDWQVTAWFPGEADEVLVGGWAIDGTVTASGLRVDIAGTLHASLVGLRGVDRVEARPADGPTPFAAAPAFAVGTGTTRTDEPVVVAMRLGTASAAEPPISSTEWARGRLSLTTAQGVLTVELPPDAPPRLVSDPPVRTAAPERSVLDRVRPGLPVRRVLLGIATYRRPAELSRLLESLRAQLNADVTVLVVDNDADASARHIVTGWPGRARYVVETVPGIAASRNRALDEFEAGDYDALVFVDDDEWVPATWLPALVGHANHTVADVVTGNVTTVLPDATPRWIRRGGFLQRPLHPAGDRVPTAATNNTLLTRSAWEAAGRPRFDPEFSDTGGSDTDFFVRMSDAGALIEFAGDAATVFEDAPAHRLTLRWIARRGHRVGIVNGRLMRRREGRLATLRFGLRETAVGGLKTLKQVLQGNGLQAWAFNRFLFGWGCVTSLVGHRIREYQRGS